MSEKASWEDVQQIESNLQAQIDDLRAELDSLKRTVEYLEHTKVRDLEFRIDDNGNGIRNLQNDVSRMGRGW